MTDRAKIRNFSIIAHIDHGKSTLADRLLEECNTVDQREMEDQILDNMDLERERGITIKARAVRLQYQADDGETYILNLIDTPGHVDFNYEVSRSPGSLRGRGPGGGRLPGRRGPDAGQHLSGHRHDLEVLPVINKIDLPAARSRARSSRRSRISSASPPMDAPGDLRQKRHQHPRGAGDDRHGRARPRRATGTAPLQALIFDSQYDSYKGVIVYFRVMDGAIRPGHGRPDDGHRRESIRWWRCGYLQPQGHGAHAMRWAPARWAISPPPSRPSPTPGWAIPSPGRKTRRRSRCRAIRQVQPMVFSGVYPADGSKYPRPAGCAGKAEAQRRLPVL